MPLDINVTREEKGADMKKIRDSQAARFKDPKQLQDVIDTDKAWRKALFDMEQARKEKKKLDKEVGMSKKEGKDSAALEEQAKNIKAQIADLEKKSEELKVELDKKMNVIGNFVHESVPVSQDEDKDNKVVATWGVCRATTPLHHHELMWMIDGYEPERGVTVAGHRGYFLKGVGVLLNQALINYGLSFLLKRKYTPIQPPFFMKREVMAETAQLEDFDEQLYKVVGEAQDKDMYLIATSEQPISAFHRQEVLLPEQLPLRYAGISTCFRKEAGSHGKDAWGIFRIHQFEKVEQFCITDHESSWAMHEEMIKIAQEFYQSLGLAYRVVVICSGALNNAAAKKYDLEAWFPSLGVYRELVSASNCTDYQSRAMDTKLGHPKPTDKERKFVHMLNATLCATERTICCILENYQDEKGVKVPEVLRPFMGGLERMEFKREKPKMGAFLQKQAEKAAAEAKGAGADGAGAEKAADKEADKGKQDKSKGKDKGGKGEKKEGDAAAAGAGAGDKGKKGKDKQEKPKDDKPKDSPKKEGGDKQQQQQKGGKKGGGKS